MNINLFGVSVAALSVVLLAGCSEQTQEATKEAVTSAAEDTKDNLRKAGEVIEAGAEKAKEEFNDNDSNDAATEVEGDSADADNIPESQEVNP